MSEHRTTVEWVRAGPFKYESYARDHVVRFSDGIQLPGTAAPANIPPSAAGAPGADPEQMLVAALSACHMLWFLHIACRANFTVERYVDEAVGVLDKTWISKVTLRPRVAFSGAPPSAAEHARLHEEAHRKCYVANSVKTAVTIEPGFL